jgi:hypothetical protein
MTPLHTITPKVLIAFLTFGIIYQLSHHSPLSISTTDNEQPDAVWFKDAVKAPSGHEKGNGDPANMLLTTVADVSYSRYYRNHIFRDQLQRYAYILRPNPMHARLHRPPEATITHT